MNKELDQWIYKNLPFMWENCSMSVNELIEHLKENPHLLREDGDSKESIIEENTRLRKNNEAQAQRILEFLKRDAESYVSEMPNPRPTDMEQEAREMFNKYYTLKDDIEPWYYLDEKDAITALTEFGKMWYEMGMDSFWVAEKQLRETRNSYHDLSEKLKVKVSELKKELAEKDALLSDYENRTDSVRISRLESELNAAKEQIESLECRISNINGANAILESQLAEKEKGIQDWRSRLAAETAQLVRTQSLLNTANKQFTAAKEQIAKLEQQNADLELALRNL